VTKAPVSQQAGASHLVYLWSFGIFFPFWYVVPTYKEKMATPVVIPIAETSFGSGTCAAGDFLRHPAWTLERRTALAEDEVPEVFTVQY
jgi:hypothetical protein